MRVTIKQLTQASALRIANEWRYSGEYSEYNLNQNPTNYAAFVSVHDRGNHYWQLTVSGVLIGWFSVTPTSTRGNDVLNLGMVPASTGQGYGPSFVAAIIDFVQYRLHSHTLIITVAESNVRARKVAAACGFTTVHHSQGTNDRHQALVQMRREF